MGMALQALGVDANRLESGLQFLAEKLNVRADFFAMPTSLMMVVDQEGVQTPYFKRTEPGEIDLGKLSQINSIGDKVCAQKIFSDEALLELAKLKQQSALYPKWLTVLCFGFVASCIVIFMGGNGLSSLLASLIGSIVGFFMVYKNRLKLTYVADAVAACFAGFLSCAFSSYFPEIMYDKVVVASLIVVLPGVSLTMAMTEIAENHLVAGTSRLMSSLLVLFKIAFGVALGMKIFSFFDLPLYAHTFEGYSIWFSIGAIILSALALVVLFSTKINDFLWIATSCVCAFVVNYFGKMYFGPELGILFAGAFVAASSNAFSNFTKKPILVTLLPGLLVLVPGALALHSLNYMYEENFLMGLESGFNALSIILSLVAGIFMGNILVRTSQHL